MKNRSDATFLFQAPGQIKIPARLLTIKPLPYRQKDLVKLSAPIHSALERLQTELVSIRENSLGAMSLDRDLRYFLGLVKSRRKHSCMILICRGFGSLRKQVTPPTALSLRVLRKKVLERLGLTLLVAPPAKLKLCSPHQLVHRREYVQTPQPQLAEESTQHDRTDIVYDQPYSFVGKCLAGKNIIISHEEIEQLVRTGDAETQRGLPVSGCKVLIAAGPLTDHAQKTAKQHAINVMRPNTLQRLSELKAQHPGAIDLIKLKTCLQAVPYGEAADEKINQFIQEILDELKVRAALVEAVKACMESTEQPQVSSDAICATYAVLSREDLPSLSMGEVQDILIELSSPVAGFLGRMRGNDEQYRFYFLREIFVDSEQSMLTFG